MKFKNPRAKALLYFRGIVSQGLKALLPRLKPGAPTTRASGQCVKYSDWRTDASLGELAPGREPELLAHAAECEECREAYNHARELSAFADRIDRGVESLVAGEPSPHFNSRLRARIAEDAAAAGFNWRAWTPIAATAVALAILLVAVPLRSPRVNAPYVAKNTPAPLPSAQPLNSPARAVSAATHSRPELLHSHGQPVKARVKAHPDAQVLVEPGQLAKIMQFADAVHAGHVDGEKLLAAQQQVNAPLEIKPIEIAPLSPPDPNVPTSAVPDSSRP